MTTATEAADKKEDFSGEDIPEAGCGTILRRISSVCPVCLRKVPAVLERFEGRPGVWLRKSCPSHGEFSTLVWKDLMDLDEWTAREDPLSPEEEQHCNADCRSCTVHGQDTCCVILEVTNQCNLRCPFCFARGGESRKMPSREELYRAVRIIAEKGRGPLIQFAGGEPTLRDDLPDLVRFARDAGCSYTQINTNGIRLSEDEEYVRRLSEAGLDIVFLQFDGTDDSIYRALRGRDLLDVKLRAIRNCSRYRIGVTLVPTIVRGINEHALGKIVEKAAELFPAVRSVHFQPVTYLGRYPGKIPGDRYTLDELMADLCRQTGIPEKALLPSRCDHALCEFHSTFLVSRRRQLIPMTDRSRDIRSTRTAAARNRSYVAEHWRRAPGDPDEDPVFTENRPPAGELVTLEREDMGFDDFIRRMRTETMKISAMAFQDAMNLNLERLYRCSLHVYENGKLLPFCMKYLGETI